MNFRSKEIFINKAFLLVLISLLCGYIFTRAYLLSFTHDECLTFKIVTGISGYEFSANNHFLNTYLVTLFYSIFGAKEIFLRLPNVLAFVVYAYFTYKILVRFKSLIFILLGATLLLLNPYVLDFFSLARGYGLSLAFGIGALHYLFINNPNDSVKQFNINFFIAMVMSLLSVYASLIMINFNLAILLVFVTEFFVLWRNHSKHVSLKDKILFFTIIAGNISFLVIPAGQLLFLKEINGLYVGGSQGFIYNTIASLVQRSMYSNTADKWEWIQASVIALFGFSVIFQLMCLRYNQLAKITLVMMLMIGAFICQHIIFGSLYPEGRMALIFIPLYGLFITQTFHEVYLVSKGLKTLKLIMKFGILIFIALPLVFHYYSIINFKYVPEWRYDENTRAVMDEIKKQEDKNDNHQHKITLSNEWYFEPSINYYRHLYSLNYLNPATRDPLSKDADYIYCTEDEKYQLKLNMSFIILKQFDDIHTVLLKKKDPPALKQIN